MHQTQHTLLRLFILALVSFSGGALMAQQRGFEPEHLTPVGPEGKTPARAHMLPERPANGAGARTTTVTPVQLGRSKDLTTSYRSIHNCLAIDDSTGLAVFIHRNDPAVFGGSDKAHRYDISTDYGQTWSSNIGPVNPTQPTGRLSQVALYDAPGNTIPTNGKLIYVGDRDNGSGGYSGFEISTANIVSTGSPNPVDFQYATSALYGSGGLAKRNANEYWTSRFNMKLVSNSLVTGDSLRIYKGVYAPATQTITWSRQASKFFPWSQSISPSPMMRGTCMAFSPDGNFGWIALAGDLIAGRDSIFAPILLKSTDGGTTWSNPIEVDLNSFPWVADSLRALWVDAQGNPQSSGQAVMTYEYDLTVDANGNPHLFFVMGTGSVPGSPPSYSVYPALSKYAVDLTSSNQGQSFNLRLVAPILTFRGDIGTTNAVTQDNYPQISRSSDGQRIFYAWRDSDTSLVTGSMAGVGFGVSDNIQPDLWIAGIRLTDGYSTCIKAITQGDPIWGGQVNSMQMAPEVFFQGSGANTLYKLPITMPRLTTGDPFQACNFFYFGGDATLSESDFQYPPGSSVFWNGCIANPLNANIRGKVFADYNNNGLYDGPDIGLVGRQVTAGSSAYTAMTDLNGDFDIQCYAGFTYGLTAATPDPLVWSPSAPTTPYSLTISTPGTVLTGKDLGFHPNVATEDLAVSMFSPPIRPGFTTGATMYVHNLGTLPGNGTLTLRYDPAGTITGAVPPYDFINPNTFEATWNLQSLAPLLGPIAIDFNFYLPASVPLGTPLSFEAQAVTTGSDIDLSNNLDTLYILANGSYDPNDKTAMPGGTGLNRFVVPETPMKYRIRFQNTGTASAITVVVRDTIDADMDFATVKTWGASHDYVFTTEPGNVLVWTFNDIHLPDSATNEPGSHGHIDFSLAPIPGLPLGTIVDNSASIYFDFNVPVRTNNAWITYGYPPVGQDPKFTAPPVAKVYPHPVEQSCIVEFQQFPSEDWTFELLDVHGRAVRMAHVHQADRYEFLREGLPGGMYHYRITGKSGHRASGKFIIR